MTAPNILFILIDDMGWRDLACTGSHFYETPNIDRLAAQGMRFTQAYAACPVCSPTRASILTGKYPAELGLTNWIDGSGESHPNRGRLIDVPYIDHLPLSEHTIAAALREGGYATWHVGKWHLGGEELLSGPARLRRQHRRMVNRRAVARVLQPVGLPHAGGRPRGRTSHRPLDGRGHWPAGAARGAQRRGPSS